MKISHSKYHAKKVSRDGETFDSAKEYNRFLELKLLERSGKITNLRRQVPFELIPSQRIDGKIVERACVYKADFTYSQDGETVVEDVKGYKHGTAYAVFVIKRKLLLQKYGMRIKEI